MPDPTPPKRPRAPAWRCLRGKDLAVAALLLALLFQLQAGDGAPVEPRGRAAAPRAAAPAGPFQPAAWRPLVTDVAPPGYAEGSTERALFDALNEARAKGNFGLLAQDTRLDAAAARHAEYLARNLGGALSHRQEPHRPGFTGETPLDRVRAAGYDSGFSFEALSSGTTARDCLELLNTVYHLGALTVGATEVGIAVKEGGGCVIEPQVPGRPAAFQTRPAGTVGVYPYPGQTGVPAGFMPATETPNPAPDLGDAVLGPPILVDLNSEAASGLAASDIVLARFTLADATGTPLPARVLASAQVDARPGAGLDLRVDRRLVSPGHVFLLPLQPLRARSVYTVEFQGAVNGAELSRRWDFTTR